MTENRVIVVSAPSGSGKGTVIRKLMSMRDDINLSVSYTTRPPREGEVEGTHYYFVSRDQFLAMVENDEFIEWDLYQNDYYGTSKEKIDRILDAHKSVIFDITIKGAYAIRDSFPHAALVFLLPPSFGELERRLRRRGTESDAKIRGRLEEARREIVSVKNFDYFIINDDLTGAAEQLESVYLAEKCRMRGEDAELIINHICGGDCPPAAASD